MYGEFYKLCIKLFTPLINEAINYKLRIIYFVQKVLKRFHDLIANSDCEEKLHTHIPAITWSK